MANSSQKNIGKKNLKTPEKAFDGKRGEYLSLIDRLLEFADPSFQVGQGALTM